MNGLQTFEIVIYNDKLSLADSREWKRVKQRGFIVGRFGIHRLYEGQYRLTHIPTGTHFFDVSEFRRAVALAAMINELPDLKGFVTKRGFRKHNKREHDAIVAQWKDCMISNGFAVKRES